MLLLFALLLIQCTKDCDFKLATCAEVPPSNELCQAFFNRWFYNSETNSCERIAYSGCSSKGFDTIEDCEACLCR
jgi:hypothetical protein